jgi:prephenate dehydrogenase
MRAGDRVAIIGLGLIGGSLARDLAARGMHVVAFDADADRVRAAMDGGAAHEALDASLSGVERCDTVVLAIPVTDAPRVLGALAPHVRGACLITDVGSTKAGIERAAMELGLGARFVGSHPMAGSHESGWSASRSELFRGACVYVCPTPQSEAGAIRRAMELWAMLGANPMSMPAREHDIRVAWTSHAPHVVSAALGAALAHGGFPREHLGPGGRDVTRLAGSSPDLWTAIACDNAAAIDHALARVEQEIAAFRRALSGGDVTALRQRFAAASEWFHASREARSA